MENASKALIMAGSVLIALMIIGALILMFNGLSSYQSVGEQNIKEAQVIDFNNQFETYLRDNVRGSDMLSLMNRIIDYNNRKTDDSAEQFQKMNIEITGIDVANLMYDEDNDEKIVKEQYTQDSISKSKLLEKSKELEKKYESRYITSLSSNISKVMNSQTETENILPKNIENYGGYDRVKKDTASYYQYTQFKRLYFNCDSTGTKYSNLGRIINLKFVCTNKLN